MEVWNVVSGTFLYNFEHDGEVGSLAIDNDQIVSGGHDGQVVVREGVGGEVHNVYMHDLRK